MVLISMTVVSTIRIIGILLTGALMIIPVLSSLQLGLSFKRTLLLSIFFSIIVVIIGLISSFYLDLASGGIIVVVALILFLGIVVYQKIR